MILESIVTTKGTDGSVNIAPMGPEVDEALTLMTLKPFRSSQTFCNLRDTNCAVVHVTDDVELLASAAIGNVIPDRIVEEVLGRWIKLVDCCRWFAIEVTTWSDCPHSGSESRPQAQCRIMHRGEQRPMFGLNRAKHAVIEAAILATRVQMLGRDHVKREMDSLRVLVDKTGGLSERKAWQRLESFVNE